MATTFGDRIKLFALSADLIDRERFDWITRLIADYCRETLDINTVKVMLAADVGGRNPRLRRYSLGAGLGDAEDTIPLVGKKPTHQTTAAFLKNTPMWIVSASGQRKLDGCDAYRDLWSRRSRGLPAFSVIDDPANPDLAIKTSIIVPLREKSSAIGVMNFETEEYLEITEEAKEELTKIAEAVSILVRLLHSSMSQSSDTKEALLKLEDELRHPQPKLTKPKVFIASPAEGDRAVVELIREVVKTFGERLAWIDWRDKSEPGNVSEELFKEIESCRFAICYFSEPEDDGGYRDNPNVLFEAGMFHGRRDGVSLVPASWLPVREEQSPEVPFDFAQQRIIQVERTKAGKLKKTLRKDLREGVEAMLATVS